MIRFLLLPLALTIVGASAQSQFRAEFKNPFVLFGEEKTHAYVTPTASHTHICFNSYYSALKSDKDCISLAGKTEKKILEKVEGSSSVLTAELKKEISTIPSSAQSKISLTLTVDSSSYKVDLYSAGLHSGVVISTEDGLGIEVVILVKGKEIKRQSSGKKFSFDLSGCTKEDGSVVVFKYEKKLPNCGKEACATPGKVSITKGCGANELCVSDSCKYRATCTFTGPSVIDHKGQVGAIQDQCNYHLMALKVLPDFSVEGIFRDRRRKDKSFLDTVVLKHKSTKHHLKQGGTVTEGNNVLTLTNQPKVLGMMKFTKSDKGVTVKYYEKDMDVVVFFNGYTAQIDITGPASKDPGLKHLCANAQSAEADVRATTGSCEKKHTDKDDPKIDCKKATARCNILNGDPFTSCHKHVSPNAFIKACTDTMCHYPAVDGLTCYFLEAYSRACSLYNTPGVTGWRSKANCPTDAKALCQDKPCASNEFCGQVGENKDWGCLCQPIHSQTYRDSDSLGDPTTCGAGGASASLINCLLLEKGIDYTTLQLNDASCKGNLVDGKVVFKFDSTKTCGADVTDNNGAVNYKNSIQTKEMPADAILRQDPVDISFACDFASPKLQVMSFKVSGSTSVVNKPVKSGTFKYQLTMTAYANEALTEVLKSVQLNQRVWIELKATGVDSKLSAVLFDSCWATKQKDPEKAPKYFLVSNGCKNPKDDTVVLTGNGAGIQSIFSFKAFQFPNSNDEVFLHCKVSMCGIKKDKSCVPDCKKSRRRRSVSSLDEDKDSSLVTMAWVI